MSEAMDKTEPEYNKVRAPCASKYRPENMPPLETRNKAIEEIHLTISYARFAPVKTNPTSETEYSLRGPAR